MKFKLPIGTAVYTVSVVDGLRHGDTLAYGLTMLNEKSIQLDSKQQRLQGMHTFLHEFFHAALHEYGVHCLERDDEELVVDALAHAMCISLQRSKQFRELLAEIK